MAIDNTDEDGGRGLKIGSIISPGNLLVRADASAEIGTGHVMRCLALAQAWSDAGGNAAFVMAQSTPSIEARLAAENFKVVSISAHPGSNEDAELTNQCARKMEAEWLVVDGYPLSSRYQGLLQTAERKLLCIDDAGKCDRYVADIVLNQNPGLSEESFADRRPGSQLLLGPSFCLLRREFTPWREWQRRVSARGSNILITLGGGTPAGPGIRVMESVGGTGVEDLRAIFVVGGSSPNMEALESCAAKFPGKICIHRDVSNMAELMAHADLAISAAGSTCWELCFLGLPSILLDVADDQIPIAIEMERRQCSLYAGNGNTISSDDLARMIENLVASSEARESMSHSSRKLVDGLGAERVVSAMLVGIDERLAADAKRARA